MIGTMVSSYAYYDTLGNEVTTKRLLWFGRSKGEVSLIVSQFEVEL
jgi:hypothetical protein